MPGSLTRTQRRSLITLRNELQRQQDTQLLLEPCEEFFVLEEGTGQVVGRAADRDSVDIELRRRALAGPADGRFVAVRAVSSARRRADGGDGMAKKQLTLPAGKAPVGVKPDRVSFVTKMMPAEVKQVDLERRRIRLVITATKVDRDKEVVVAAGAKLDAFRANPIILFSHMPMFPVANATELVLREDEIEAEIEFFQPDESALAERLFRLYSRGKMRAASIGFLPITVTEDKIMDGQEGRAFLEWELLEFSLVAIPSLREALTTEEAARHYKTFFDGHGLDDPEEGLDDPEGKVKEAPATQAPSPQVIGDPDLHKTEQAWQAWVKRRPEKGAEDPGWQEWLKQRPPTSVQSLVLSKEQFETVAEARKWVTDHDFRADKVDETDDSFRFRQFEPSLCEEDSFRTISLDTGVSAVICRKEEEEAAAPEPAKTVGLTKEAQEKLASARALIDEVLQNSACWGPEPAPQGGVEGPAHDVPEVDQETVQAAAQLAYELEIQSLAETAREVLSG